jgi:hypothetical protein
MVGVVAALEASRLGLFGRKKSSLSLCYGKELVVTAALVLVGLHWLQFYTIAHAICTNSLKIKLFVQNHALPSLPADLALKAALRTNHLSRFGVDLQSKSGGMASPATLKSRRYGAPKRRFFEGLLTTKCLT